MDVTMKNAAEVTGSIQGHPYTENAAGRVWKEVPQAVKAGRQPMMAGQQAPMQRQNSRVQFEVQEFAHYFPGVKPDEIKPTVWEKVKQGIPLSMAYLMDENERLKKELDGEKQKFTAAEQNARNRENSMGSAKTRAGNAVEDAFLKAFNQA